jgi:hypothetical protein
MVRVRKHNSTAVSTKHGMKVSLLVLYFQCNSKQTPWPLVRERTIPTDRPPLVDEI